MESRHGEDFAPAPSLQLDQDKVQRPDGAGNKTGLLRAASASQQRLRFGKGNGGEAWRRNSRRHGWSASPAAPRVTFAQCEGNVLPPSRGDSARPQAKGHLSSPRALGASSRRLQPRSSASAPFCDLLLGKCSHI